MLGGGFVNGVNISARRKGNDDARRCLNWKGWKRLEKISAACRRVLLLLPSFAGCREETDGKQSGGEAGRSERLNAGEN